MAAEAPASSDGARKGAGRKRGGSGEAETHEKRMKKFSRGSGVDTKGIEDKKLRGQLKYKERVYREAAHQAAKVEQWLLPSDAGSLEAEGVERTYQFKQRDIVPEVGAGAAKLALDISLPQLGPYRCAFTRDGTTMVLGGRKGHLASMRWKEGRLNTEVQVRETVRDVVVLHNDQFFAAAQKRFTYIYDKRGIEIHRLDDHTDVARLEFLPHHFLLCSVGKAGVLAYQDTSTGRVVAHHRTRRGPCAAMRQNPWNAVVCLGHSNGTVTMWTPNLTTPAVSMLCHRGPVRDVAVDGSGRYMVTAGADSLVKVWDVRTYREVHSYFSHAPVDCVDVSQRGMLAIGWGRKVQVWRDALATKAKAPYMVHELPAGGLSGLRFCPYEDVLACGHGGGLSTMLVPGAGEPNFDSWVADPFQGRKARQEMEVRQLLDKLQPEMIVLDPGSVGRVRKEPAEVQRERAEAARRANADKAAAQREKNEARTKMKGKNKPTRKHRKKQDNVIRERKDEIKGKMRQQGVAAERATSRAGQAPPPEDVPRALARLYQR
ncbi:unnamed protein product [Pedinophyceae sp. YPF-701]|nr:unnamed protein product [Pedinophyceae sp. YPF-701]